MNRSSITQKVWIRLSSNVKNRKIFRGNRKRRKYNFGRNKDTDFIKVEIINAVSGEKSVAISYEPSKYKLKKWLMMHNTRAQFSSLLIKSKSLFARLPETEWQDFPIIVKVDSSKFPYLIDHVGEKITIGKKTTRTIFLKTVKNTNYLEIIYTKKKLWKK